MRNIFITSIRIALTVLAAGWFCHCNCLTRPNCDVGKNDSRIFIEAIINDVERNTPWKRSKPSNDEIESPTVVQHRLLGLEFDKNMESPNDLLIRARKGDKVAMAKLESYIMQHDPTWTYRFEVQRMLALLRGIDGIARYYTKTKNQQRLFKDRRLIERSIRDIEHEALHGNWIYAIALYQFCGSLSQMGERLPWGDNQALSAKWLEKIYQLKGRDVFVSVVKNEAKRMGFSQNKFLDGTFYPHTPCDWAPAGM